MSQEASLPSCLDLLSPRQTGKVSQITSTDVRDNSLFCTDRSSLIASWPRERTRLEEEVQKTSQGPELIYDWTIGGYRRKTEQETWARINGETDVETLNERQVNMRRRQHIELAKNGLIYEITNESQVSRRREQYMKLAKNGPHATGSTAHHKLGTNLAATNKDTGVPAQQDLKSLRSRIAAALKTGE
jgi:hypothetical protein